MRCTQNYFCYCDLQTENRQLQVLGRKLSSGKKEILPCFKIIEKKNIVGPFAVKTDNCKEKIEGTLYKISFADLFKLDEYEKAFKTQRITADLLSGAKVWIYVDP